jgi:hypothetical protein
LQRAAVPVRRAYGERPDRRYRQQHGHPAARQQQPTPAGRQSGGSLSLPTECETSDRTAGRQDEGCARVRSDDEAATEDERGPLRWHLFESGREPRSVARQRQGKRERQSGGLEIGNARICLQQMVDDDLGLDE